MIRHAVVVAALTAVSCAGGSSPRASVAQSTPSTGDPVLQGSSEVPDRATLASGNEASAPAVAAQARGEDISDRYGFEVRVLDRPPSPVFFLAHFSETPGESCLSSLTAHARGLGANALLVDRDAPCAGSAFFVRGAQSLNADEDAGAGTSPDRLATISMERWLWARWKRPPSISENASRRLCVVVQFTVSPMRRVWDVRGQPIRSSGNQEFDKSVKAALESAIDEHATVPAPPRDLVGEHVVYRLEFSEGDHRICRQPTPYD